MKAVKDLSTINQQPLSMSSIEIAELTGKQHKNVMADIRCMFDDLELLPAEFSVGNTYTNGKGGEQERAIFNLPKDLTLTLVSGYNIKLRYSVIKRLEELEARLNINFNDPKAAAQAFLRQLEETERLEIENRQAANKIIEDKPKVAAYDALMNTDAHYTSSEAGSFLGMSAQVLGKELQGLGWLTKGSRPSDAGITILATMKGFMVTKTLQVNTRIKIVKNNYITQRGMDYLLDKHGLLDAADDVNGNIMDDDEEEWGDF